MSKKWWCLFGIHEYAVIQSGPFKKSWGSEVMANGSYFILNCQCCGKIKRKVVC
jgi:hypothetical protein